MRFSRNYNLAIFSTSIKRIYKEQMRLKKEVCDAHACYAAI